MMKPPDPTAARALRAGHVRSGVVYGAANVLSAAVPFLLLPVLTRVLSPPQYGQVISFYVLVAVCAAVAGLGLHSAVGVRWLDEAAGDPGRYTGSAIVVVLITTAIAAVVAAMIAPHVGIELAPSLCALAAVVAGANVVNGMRFAVWQSHQRPFPAAMLQISLAVLNVGLSLVAVLVLHLGGAGRILGAACASALIAVASIMSLIYDRAATRASWVDIRALLRFGVPLTPHTLAGTMLGNADRLAVASQLGAATLGVYGTATQLGSVIGVLADAATKAYSPTAYRWLSRRSARSRLRVVAVAYLSIPCWLLVAASLWGIFQIGAPKLLGAEYRNAAVLTTWFLLGGAMNAVYLNVAGLFFFTGKTEWISLASVAAALLALLIAPLAVARFGVVGGGVTYVASQAILLLAAFVLADRIAPMPWKRPGLAIRVLFGRSDSAAP
jgi:O-antigen/teichoic acid export membrane protein